MIDYKLLEALASVIEAGGFEKGAKRLHLTQSAVSQRIKQLEEQVGMILLTRTTPPTPTETGQHFLSHYAKVKQLESDLSCENQWKSSGDTARTISLGVNADSLATWILDALEPIMSQQKILLDIHVDDQEYTLQLLQKGLVSCCVTTSDKPFQGCRVEPLGVCNYALVASPQFMKTWFSEGFTKDTDTSSLPTVFFNRKDELTMQFFREILKSKTELKNIHYVPSNEKYLDIILRGYCYGVVPEQQIRPFVKTGQLIELLPGSYLPLNLYFHYWNLRSSWLKYFTTTFIASARAQLQR